MSPNTYNYCPYNPPHTEEWLEAFFAKDYFKKPYDRFMWWRSFTPKRKPLLPKAPIVDRIKNGDFDVAPFKFEAEIVEHRLRKKWFELQGQHAKFLEVCAVDLARRKRLLEDQEREEKKRLDGFFKAMKNLFGLSQVEVEEYLSNFDGESVFDFYKYLLKKNEDKPY